MRKSIIVLSLLILPAYVGLGVAQDLKTEQITLDGNERKGQYLYRKYCREACHNEAGEGKDISPMDLTFAEWEAHIKNLANLPCRSKWDENITPQDLNDIFSYLHNGAKDSPTPTK